MAKKVLIIDDSPVDAAMVKDFLDQEGIDVAIAGTAQEGLKKALATKPDLIVLDLVLPDMSGFELCPKLKQEVSLSKTIIVVVSIKDRVEDINKAFHAGADDYIIKPPQPEFLFKKIMLYLGLKPV